MHLHSPSDIGYLEYGASPQNRHHNYLKEWTALEIAS